MDGQSQNQAALKAKGEWPNSVLPYLGTIDLVVTLVVLLLQGEELVEC